MFGGTGRTMRYLSDIGPRVRYTIKLSKPLNLYRLQFSEHYEDFQTTDEHNHYLTAE